MSGSLPFQGRGLTDNVASVGIAAALDMVRDFHIRCRVDYVHALEPPADPGGYEPRVLRSLANVCKANSESAMGAFKHSKDSRFLRGHLILEELGELFEGMANGDEEKTLDALGDLLYVLLGSAVTMDLPLHEAFVEIHESNMTKRRQQHDPDGERVRDKGPDYRPPDLAEILKKWRLSTEASSPAAGAE